MAHGRAPIRRIVRAPGHGVGRWHLPPGAGSSGRFDFDTPVAPMDTPKAGACSVLSQKRKGGPRKNCPVQLIFKGGRPYLRLCTAPNVQGKLVPVPANGVAAQEIAARICAHWAAGDKKFERWTEYEGFGGVRRRR